MAISTQIRRAACAVAAFCCMGGAAQAAVLAHNYQLNGSLADGLGGPALVDAGGTLGVSNYTFLANQGLSLTGGLANGGDYSISMAFQYSNVSGYRKVLDFTNRGSDAGFYVLSSALNFYPVTTGPSSVVPVDTMVDVMLTRDGGTKEMNAYVNGALQFSFVDSLSYGVFSATGNIMQFFKDDFATGQSEASGGVVDTICVYNGALSAREVANASCSAVTSEVPEPTSLALLSLGLLGLGWSRRKAGR